MEYTLLLNSFPLANPSDASWWNTVFWSVSAEEGTSVALLIILSVNQTTLKKASLPVMPLQDTLNSTARAAHIKWQALGTAAFAQ